MSSSLEDVDAGDKVKLKRKGKDTKGKGKDGKEGNDANPKAKDTEKGRFPVARPACSFCHIPYLCF